MILSLFFNYMIPAPSNSLYKSEKLFLEKPPWPPSQNNRLWASQEPGFERATLGSLWRPWSALGSPGVALAGMLKDESKALI